MAQKEVDRQLLLTYLDGKCTQDQLRQIREYLHDEAYRDSLNLFMQEEWETQEQLPFLPLPGMKEKYQKFRTDYTEPRISRPAIPVRIRRMVAVAAVLVLAAAGIWLLLPRSNGPKDHTSTIQWLSWHNEPGHHSEFALPDSTRVYLGPAGTLRYGQNEDGGREVQLEGEAYFVVKQDPHRPFTVVSGTLSTRDIGTEFNIRYYPGEPSVTVAVASGKVQVFRAPAANASPVAASSPAAASPAATAAAVPLAALTQGQLLQYDSLTQKSDITILPDPSVIGAWRKGILSFRKQNLKEVTGELERYYGVRFQYSDPASGNILITTQFDNRSLADVLDILSLTAGVQFIREGSRILIK